jgi:hypothetical protein
MEIDLTESVAPIIVLTKVVGHWPFGNKKLYATYRWIVVASMFVYNLEQLVYVLLHIKDFEEVAAIIYRLLSTIAVMVKAYIFDRKFATVQEIVKLLEIRQFQPRNVKQKEILNLSVLTSNQLFYFISFTTFLVTVMVDSSPLLDNVKQLPSNAWFPYDYLSNKYYFATYVWQSIVLAYHGFTNVVLDVLFATLMMQIGAQCDLLNDKITNLGERCNGCDKKVLKDLHDCIEHHKLILV